MMVCYGYRSTDSGLAMPALGSLDAETEIYVLRQESRRRAPVLFSIGAYLDLGGLPVVRGQCDFMDTDSAVEGAIKRYASANPVAEPALIQELRLFVADWISKNLQPLPAHSDVDFVRWLDRTNYPLWRKMELALARKRWIESGAKLRPKDRKVKSFVKREQYDEYKYARMINSRSDVFKCFSGPIFKLIEEELFKLPWFVKKIAVADRPNYIVAMLARLNGTVVDTDYTSFEALFTPEIMKAVEMQLYKYMSAALPGGAQWYEEIEATLTGDNACWARDFILYTRGRRMSGEMCTSLGNGFSNLMFMLFACHKMGSKCVGVVEGDDGLFSIAGPVPTPEFFSRLGLRIKMGVHTDIETASFCGIIFDRQDRINVTDVRRVLCDFGWIDGRYVASRRSRALALLRCKALSLAHQYPGCPVLSALAKYGLKITAGIDVGHYVRNSPHLDWWKRNELLGYFEGRKEKPIPDRPVGDRTRDLVHVTYGVSPDEQRRMERNLLARAQSRDLSPIPAPIWAQNGNWVDYGRKYTLARLGTSVFAYPGPHKKRTSFSVI